MSSGVSVGFATRAGGRNTGRGPEGGGGAVGTGGWNTGRGFANNPDPGWRTGGRATAEAGFGFRIVTRLGSGGSGALIKSRPSSSNSGSTSLTGVVAGGSGAAGRGRP